MSKRTATYQLTAENFDDEEPQEGGTTAVSGKVFSKAAEDVMARRVIKKAKRRIDQVEAQSQNPFSVFSSLKGSNMPQAASSDETSSTSSSKQSPHALTVSFGKDISVLSGTSFQKETSDSAKPSFNLFGNTLKQTESLFGGAIIQPVIPKANGSQLSDGNEKQDSNSKAGQMYAEQITSLNISFLSWIKKHIDANPLIDLTPVFTDYTNHMVDIEKKYGKSVEESNTEKSNRVSPAKSAPIQKTPEIMPVFSKIAESTTEKPAFVSFFQANKETTFTAPEVVNVVDEAHAEEDAVEKNEHKTVTEEDAFYTTRCKLFFKKGTEWKELGVGMLYLKPLDNKIQLLVRMETAGGKVLLNVSVGGDIPAGRVGKNNVSIVSVPNPPVFTKEADGDNTKPLNYLIRVKDGNEADNLLKHIKEENKQT